MSRRRYTPEFRGRCLDAVRSAMDGASSREAAIVLVASAASIPVTSLRNWVRDAWGPARGPELPVDAELVRSQLQRQIDALRVLVGPAEETTDNAGRGLR